MGGRGRLIETTPCLLGRNRCDRRARLGLPLRARRKQLADQTGLSQELILRWVNHADLFRIRGVAGEYAELLEAPGSTASRSWRSATPTT